MRSSFLKNIMQPMDVILIILLLFGEKFLAAMVGAKQLGEDFNLDNVEGVGVYLLLGGFIIGLPAFFFGPRNRPHEINGFWPLAGIWLNAAILVLMGVTAVMILMDFQSNDPYTEEVSNLEFIFALSLFISILVLPVLLTIIYMKRSNNGKEMPDMFRSFLMIPVVIFSTAYFNYAIKYQQDNDMNFVSFYLVSLFLFIPYFFAPRWFAIGRDTEGNSFKSWVVRYTIFALAMYFQI